MLKAGRENESTAKYGNMESIIEEMEVGLEEQMHKSP